MRRAAEEGDGRCISHRYRRRSPDRLLVDVELQAHREPHHAWYDRSDLPVRGPDAADYLYPRGAASWEFTMKPRDAIIDELHRVREDIGKAHDFDVRRIAATIRQHEDENPKGIIRESPKWTTRQKKAS